MTNDWCSLSFSLAVYRNRTGRQAGMTACDVRLILSLDFLKTTWDARAQQYENMFLLCKLQSYIQQTVTHWRNISGCQEIYTILWQQVVVYVPADRVWCSIATVWVCALCRQCNADSKERQKIRMSQQSHFLSIRTSSSRAYSWRRRVWGR